MALSAGQMLGPYEILAFIDAGGMGDVYRARDQRLHRIVAIKVARDQFSERFAREARTIASLNHPNVCHLYDVGPNYLVMEYVDGTPLHLEADSYKLIDLAAQIVDGLAAAHEIGIVHRDLKPANILVTRDGKVKILDFGLATVARNFGAGMDATETMPVTHPGTAVGTVAYMSPEQARGQTLDARTDLWSLGVLLYEMAVGVRPFEGSTSALLFDGILNKTPVLPSRRNPRTPPDVERIILKLLEKDRALRYQSAAEVRADLRRAERDSSSGRRAAPVPARSRFRGAVAGISAALIVMAAAALLWNRIQSKPLTEKDILVLADFANTTADPVFDGTLREALSSALEESPFLKLMSDEQIRQDLQLMDRTPGERLTNQLARDICLREAQKATIGGSIATLGATYAIALTATNCQTGDNLAREEAEAPDTEHVLDVLAKAAKRMRSKLGESLSSIRKLESPTVRVTTGSLDAYQSFASGVAQFRAGNYVGAISMFRRATDLDPNFATAWQYLGATYVISGDGGTHIRTAYQRAFELRDRVSEHEKLAITSQYYEYAAGEFDKSREVAEVWTRTYPRDHVPHNSLGTLASRAGEIEQAVQEYKLGLRLEPRNAVLQGNLIAGYVRLDRYDEAKAVLAESLKYSPESTPLHQAALRIGFINADDAAVWREIQWFAGRPNEYVAFNARAFQAWVLGQRRRAVDFSRQAAELRKRRGLSAQPGGFPEADAVTGNCETARETVGLSPIAMALCGDPAQLTRSLNSAEEMGKQRPEDVEVNTIELPLLRAADALKRGQPAFSIDQMKSFGHIERVRPEAIYLRGLAYLQLRKGAEAVGEFQKIVDHKGANWGPYYAVSYVGLGRGAAMAGDMVKARKAYQDFLALWKDADPDIPILKKAKAEYAKLQ